MRLKVSRSSTHSSWLSGVSFAVVLFFKQSWKDYLNSVPVPTVIGRRFADRWASLPSRKEGLQKARSEGLFQITDRRTSGAFLGDDELMWTRSYGPDGYHKFWSVGQPKLEVSRLVKSMAIPDEGFAAVVLGCGLGEDVDCLVSAVPESSQTGCSSVVAGVDFAWPAIEQARRTYNKTVGAFFYHADVCELPEPVAPVEFIFDNTVFQNLHRTDGVKAYLKALSRISTPGHTVLNLNLMSYEGTQQRPDFLEVMEPFDLPLLRKDIILDSFGEDWEVLECREGVYDLDPKAVGLDGDAFYTFGGELSPAIPSWWLLLSKK